jgi:hypothetical protein
MQAGRWVGRVDVDLDRLSLDGLRAFRQRQSAIARSPLPQLALLEGSSELWCVNGTLA